MSVSDIIIFIFIITSAFNTRKVIVIIRKIINIIVVRGVMKIVITFM